MKYILRLVIPLMLLIAWGRCANIQSPTGGPKDKRPPRLLSSIPKANATGFHGTTVLLTFDELVKLKTPREEIIISPSPGKDIDFSVKGNKVFITSKTPFKDSTTYSFQFREGIQDITEGNVPPNLKLAFSTGPTIDSLSLSGEVHEVLPGTPKEKITVALYSSDTFDIFNHVPGYFTQTDKRGNFRLENLRPGNYFLYAFDDENKNLKVESRAEMFGFLPAPIALKSNIDTLSIGLVQLDSRPLKISSIRNIGNLTRVKFSKAVVDYQLSPSDRVINAFGDDHSEINIWNPPPPDSLQMTLSGTDSLGNRKDTTFYIRTTATKPIKEKFALSLGRPEINPENGRLITTISFSKPIQQYNMDSLYIQVDTTQRIPILPQDMTFRTKQKEIMVNKELPKKLFAADQNPKITVMARKNFAISLDGDTAKVLSAPTLIYWPEENGTLSIQASTKKKNYILQLVEKSSLKVLLQSINTPRLVARNIPPGNYYVRVILDSNSNGAWDPGNYYRKTEPERILYYAGSDGNRSIPVRANWEVGPLQFNF